MVDLVVELNLPLSTLDRINTVFKKSLRIQTLLKGQLKMFLFLVLSSSFLCLLFFFSDIRGRHVWYCKYKKNIVMTDCLSILYPAWRRLRAQPGWIAAFCIQSVELRPEGWKWLQLPQWVKITKSKILKYTFYRLFKAGIVFGTQLKNPGCKGFCNFQRI